MRGDTHPLGKKKILAGHRQTCVMAGRLEKKKITSCGEWWWGVTIDVGSRRGGWCVRCHQVATK